MAESSHADALELAMPPDSIEIELADGRSMRVLFHSYTVENGQFVFNLLFRGSPNILVPTLEIPEDLVHARYLPDLRRREVDPSDRRRRTEETSRDAARPGLSNREGRGGAVARPPGNDGHYR